MNLQSYRLRNFRRLENVLVDLNSEISIFVGANNSGKTSATHGLKKFISGSRRDFSFHDFSASCWSKFEALGDFTGEPDKRPSCPTISVDLWFKVEATDLHRVIDILPGLDWKSDLVGIRIELAPVDLERTLSEFHEAQAQAKLNTPKTAEGQKQRALWPKNFSDYLIERISKEFDLVYYVLDQRRFNAEMAEIAAYDHPKVATQRDGKGASLIDRLIRVDLMDAQRHLSENSGGRSEDLSRCLGRFYKRNLDQLGTDYPAMGALLGSQEQLNDHLGKVFGDTLEKLKKLGYPGLGNPSIRIETTLNPSTILASNDGARVFYALDGIEGAATSLSLPDQYNGLGFKNLIYMVVELLDLHAQWKQIEQNRPPLHIVIIEEPEAHMHAQLQQVFIREVLKLLPKDNDGEYYRTQFIITTHSPHVLYERGFKPIRYFRRGGHKTEVINLSVFYQKSAPNTRDFLERYLKITHCDLFFADAAILVEGNVERLLMPLFIESAAPRLTESYLTVLEVGGAYAYRFKSLIEFLGITCLVITDIDSVHANKPLAEGTASDTEMEDDDDIEDDEEEEKIDSAAEEPGEKSANEEPKIKQVKGTACQVDKPGALTCNQTLIQWMPKMRLASDLLNATKDDRIQQKTVSSQSTIYICYQTRRDAVWKTDTQQLVGRTLEEAFALENLAWCQEKNQKSLGLCIPKSAAMDLLTLSERIFKRVKAQSFNKTNFALALICEKDGWKVPHYIEEGLQWLAAEILPPEEPAAPAMVNILLNSTDPEEATDAPTIVVGLTEGGEA
jgi:predicted ATP-dependent endonuclease of OLD family